MERVGPSDQCVPPARQADLSPRHVDRGCGGGIGEGLGELPDDPGFRARPVMEIEDEVAQAAETGSEGVAEDKIETRRMVDGAKDLLMDRYGLDEPDAFAFIQRTAMANRTRMLEVARQVLEGVLTP